MNPEGKLEQFYTDYTSGWLSLLLLLNSAHHNKLIQDPMKYVMYIIFSLPWCLIAVIHPLLWILFDHKTNKMVLNGSRSL